MGKNQSNFGGEFNEAISNDRWGPVDPEEEAISSNDDVFPDMPDLNDPDPTPKLDNHHEPAVIPEHATSLNEELTEKIKDNPNKFLGCGG